MVAVKVLMPILVALATLAGLFNIIRLVFLLVAIGRWTDGSYHQPALTAVQVLGTVTCVPIAAVAAWALVKGYVRPHGIEFGGAVYFIAGAVASVALFWIHLEEADVTVDGFRQANYEVTEGDSIRLYNSSNEPVTICLGRTRTCDSGAEGPAALRSPGLTLGAGSTRLVTFDKAGHYPITVVIAADSGPSGNLDTDIHVVPPPDNDGPDLPY